MDLSLSQDFERQAALEEVLNGINDESKVTFKGNLTQAPQRHVVLTNTTNERLSLYRHQ